MHSGTCISLIWVYTGINSGIIKQFENPLKKQIPLRVPKALRGGILAPQLNFKHYPDACMPDITMCTNSACQLSKTCYRFNAAPSQYRQSYAVFKPFINEAFKTECKDYMKPKDKNSHFKPS